MSILLFISLMTTGIYALGSALKHKAWNSSYIAMAFCISALSRFLLPVGLFYHSLALIFLGGMALVALVLLGQTGSNRHWHWAIVLTALPVLLAILFKVLSLQGIALLRWGVVLSSLSFIYLSIDRRTYDHYWAHVLYLTIVGVELFFMT